MRDQHVRAGGDQRERLEVALHVELGLGVEAADDADR
jgi:hypothetical protein